MQSVVMTWNYVTWHGILEYNRKVLRQTTDKKQNCFSSNCVEDISVKCLRQKLNNISHDNKSD